MAQVSKQNALHHYKWGNNCDGWVYVNTPGLSVKQEYMPPATAEALHYHADAMQFFFILDGTATFEVDGELFTVEKNSGFVVEPGKKHRISNNSVNGLEFILSSQPSTNNDRHNC